MVSELPGIWNRLKAACRLPDLPAIVAVSPRKSSVGLVKWAEGLGIAATGETLSLVTLWSPRRGGWSGRNNRYRTQKRCL
jgi:hypothetical protein